MCVCMYMCFYVMCSLLPRFKRFFHFTVKHVDRSHSLILQDVNKGRQVNRTII